MFLNLCVKFQHARWVRSRWYFYCAGGRMGSKVREQGRASGGMLALDRFGGQNVKRVGPGAQELCVDRVGVQQGCCERDLRDQSLSKLWRRNRCDLTWLWCGACRRITMLAGEVDPKAPVSPTPKPMADGHCSPTKEPGTYHQHAGSPSSSGRSMCSSLITSLYFGLAFGHFSRSAPNIEVDKLSGLTSMSKFHPQTKLFIHQHQQNTSDGNGHQTNFPLLLASPSNVQKQNR